MHRGVFLYSKPHSSSIADYCITTTVEGQLSVEVHVDGSDGTAEVQLQLYGPHRHIHEQGQVPAIPNLVAQCSVKIDSAAADDDQNACVSGKLFVDGVELWSAEDPALYTLVMVTRDVQTQQLVDCESTLVGFRQVQLAGCELLVNGRAVMLAGVNRHDHDQHKGKTVTDQSMLADVQLLKRFNFNAIRTSHYP